MPFNAQTFVLTSKGLVLLLGFGCVLGCNSTAGGSSTKDGDESQDLTPKPQDSPSGETSQGEGNGSGTTSDQGSSDNSPSSKDDTAPGSDRIDQIQIKTADWVFDARAAGPESGRLVLLLHGFPETSLEWTEQLKALGKAGYRAVAPDQRGYSPGARPAEVSAYATEKLVQDLLDIADQLKSPKFHLVGHDWGAAVAWALAGKHPDRVLSLTPISVPHPDAFSAELKDKSSCQYEASSYFDLFIKPNFEDTLLAFNAAGLRNSYEGLPPERIEEYVKVLGNKAALGAGLNWYRANIKDRNTVNPPTGPIKVPTRFIWSDQDKAICKEGAEATKNYVSASYSFHALAGVNHWVPELAAEKVSELLLEHIAAFDE